MLFPPRTQFKQMAYPGKQSINRAARQLFALEKFDSFKFEKQLPHQVSTPTI